MNNVFSVDSLFAYPAVNRVHGSLHPDNYASAMVMERLGFLYEGTSRQSFWVDGVVSDDPHYAILREEWKAWGERLRTPPINVSLVTVTPENLSTLLKLTTHHSQERFIPSVSQSLAEALVSPLERRVAMTPWYRAIEADGELVGFVMLADASATVPDPFLWRLLIDRRHQRRGIGRRVLDLLVDDRRAKGDYRLTVSFRPGLGSPDEFYSATDSSLQESSTAEARSKPHYLWRSDAG